MELAKKRFEVQMADSGMNVRNGVESGKREDME
jgi:hypothetical protein